MHACIHHTQESPIQDGRTAQRIPAIPPVTGGESVPWPDGTGATAARHRARPDLSDGKRRRVRPEDAVAGRQPCLYALSARFSDDSFRERKLLPARALTSRPPCSGSGASAARAQSVIARHIIERAEATRTCWPHVDEWRHARVAHMCAFCEEEHRRPMAALRSMDGPCHAHGHPNPPAHTTHTNHTLDEPKSNFGPND